MLIVICLFNPQLQWAAKLGEKGYSINHIDNPIYNDVPDTNEDFLAKTRRSIENLKEHQDIHVRLLRSKKTDLKTRH